MVEDKDIKEITLWVSEMYFQNEAFDIFAVKWQRRDCGYIYLLSYILLLDLLYCL